MSLHWRNFSKSYNITLGEAAGKSKHSEETKTGAQPLVLALPGCAVTLTWRKQRRKRLSDLKESDVDFKQMDLLRTDVRPARNHVPGGAIIFIFGTHYHSGTLEDECEHILNEQICVFVKN